MTTKRKVPTTKAGKPDKRYVKSVNAKSKATGKAPTKRTQKRRAKPQLKGYSANPVKEKKWIFQGEYKGRPAYLKIMPDEYGDGMSFDDERAMVFTGTRSKMETLLKHLKWAGKDRPEQAITDTLKIVDVTKK